MSHLFGLQGSLEKSKEGAQTETIHVVQFGQVTDHKEQSTATLSQWQVRITFLSRENNISNPWI